MKRTLKIGLKTVTLQRNHRRHYQQCSVCSYAPCFYAFYGAIVCDSCRTFFRRQVLTSKSMKCNRRNSCHVTVATRKICPRCRFDKCLKAGMKPALVGSLTDHRDSVDDDVDQSMIHHCHEASDHMQDTPVTDYQEKGRIQSPSLDMIYSENEKKNHDFRQQQLRYLQLELQQNLEIDERSDISDDSFYGNHQLHQSSLPSFIPRNQKQEQREDWDRYQSYRFTASPPEQQEKQYKRYEEQGFFLSGFNQEQHDTQSLSKDYKKVSLSKHHEDRGQLMHEACYPKNRQMTGTFSTSQSSNQIPDCFTFAQELHHRSERTEEITRDESDDNRVIESNDRSKRRHSLTQQDVGEAVRCKKMRFLSGHAFNSINAIDMSLGKEKLDLHDQSQCMNNFTCIRRLQKQENQVNESFPWTDFLSSVRRPLPSLSPTSSRSFSPSSLSCYSSSDHSLFNADIQPLDLVMPGKRKNEDINLTKKFPKKTNNLWNQETCTAPSSPGSDSSDGFSSGYASSTQMSPETEFKENPKVSYMNMKKDFKAMNNTQHRMTLTDSDPSLKILASINIPVVKYTLVVEKKKQIYENEIHGKDKDIPLNQKQRHFCDCVDGNHRRDDCFKLGCLGSATSSGGDDNNYTGTKRYGISSPPPASSSFLAQGKEKVAGRGLSQEEGEKKYQAYSGHECNNIDVKLESVSSDDENNSITVVVPNQSELCLNSFTKHILPTLQQERLQNLFFIQEEMKNICRATVTTKLRSELDSVAVNCTSDEVMVMEVSIESQARRIISCSNSWFPFQMLSSDTDKMILLREAMTKIIFLRDIVEVDRKLKAWRIPCLPDPSVKEEIKSETIITIDVLRSKQDDNALFNRYMSFLENFDDFLRLDDNVINLLCMICVLDDLDCLTQKEFVKTEREIYIDLLRMYVENQFVKKSSFLTTNELMRKIADLLDDLIVIKQLFERLALESVEESV